MGKGSYANASNRCVWFRIPSNVRFCEHGNETSGVIHRRAFLDQLSDCQLLKKDFSSTNYVTQRWVHKLYKTSEATSKFKAPAGWLEANSILMTYKFETPPQE
jgi:hypothetical protein